MNNRVLALVLAVLLVGGIAAPALAAADNVDGDAGNSTVKEPESDPAGGSYDIDTLRRSGTKPSGAEDAGVRSLGSPPMGFVALQYPNPTLFDVILGSEGSYQYIEAGQEVKSNSIRAYGSAYGEVAGEYDMVIVYWQKETRTTGNGTEETIAERQNVDRVKVNLDEQELYSRVDVSLRDHYDETWETTVWLEQNGQKVDGAQWYFSHRSNPDSKAVDIQSSGGAWGFAMRTTLLPGIVALIAGLTLARMTLRKTARGPGYGVSAWLFLLGIIGFVVGLVGYYQIAVILSYIPYIMGVSIGVIAYAAGLTFHPPAKRIAFMKRKLDDAVTIPGRENGMPETDGGDAGAEAFDELTEALKVDLPEVPAVKTPDGYRIPEIGLGPFISRFFAKAALLDVSEIATRETVGVGRIDEIIHVTPDSEEALKHKPARLVRSLPISKLDSDSEIPGTELALAWVKTAMIVAIPPAVGLALFREFLNIPIVGAIVGVFVVIILSYSAEDGFVEFTAAEPHYKQAEDSLTMLQRAHKEAKDQQSAKEEMWEERARSVKEAREESEDERRTVTDEILDALGGDSGNE